MTTKNKQSQTKKPRTNAAKNSRREIRGAFDRGNHKVKNTLPSLAKQSFKDECDINNIVSRFIKTGVMPQLRMGEPNYGFAPSITFHEACQIVHDAQDAFDELPSDIRRQFKNDPAEFLEFVENPENGPKLADMGLTDQIAPQTVRLADMPSDAQLRALMASTGDSPKEPSPDGGEGSDSSLT